MKGSEIASIRPGCTWQLTTLVANGRGCCSGAEYAEASAETKGVGCCVQRKDDSCSTDVEKGKNDPCSTGVERNGPVVEGTRKAIYV